MRIPKIEAEIDFDKCDTCIHNKYLHTKADGTKVYECDTHTCEYKENKE